MRVNYKGFEIEVTKEPSVDGNKMLFYSVFRIEDGYELTSGYSESKDTVRNFIKSLKERVDMSIDENKEEEALEPCPNPECYEPYNLHVKEKGFTYVWCKGCGMRGPMYDNHPEDSIQDWNGLPRKPCLLG